MISTIRFLNTTIPPCTDRTKFDEDFPHSPKIADSDSSDKTSTLSNAVKFCTRDMYHYARVSGQHVLECVMDTALSAVKREQLHEASNVCVQFYL